MKLRYIGHFVGWLLLSFNILIAGLMLFCAYSPYIDPVTYPILACAGLAFPIFGVLNFAFLLFWLIFHRKYALLPIIAILCCWGQLRTYAPLHFKTSKVPDGAFKILSYNVMAYDHNKPHTAETPNGIVQYLVDCDADIICTQEGLLYKGKTNRYLSEEALNGVMAVYPYKSHIQEKQNGWNCFSRFPILSAKRIDYESESNGSVMYEIKIGNDTVLVINNHLESNKLTVNDKAVYKDLITGPEKDKVKSASKLLINKVSGAISIRAKQADAIAEVVRNSRHKYIVVCGDFNDSPISYTHRIIGENLNDAFVNSGCGLGISYNQNAFYFRIDHILTNDNLESYNCTVDNSIDDSDHYPIWCYLKMREK